MKNPIDSEKANIYGWVRATKNKKQIINKNKLSMCQFYLKNELYKVMLKIPVNDGISIAS